MSSKKSQQQKASSKKSVVLTAPASSARLRCLQALFTLEFMVKGIMAAALVVITVNSLSYVNSGDNKLWTTKVKIWHPKPIFVQEPSSMKSLEEKPRQEEIMEQYEDTDSILYPSQATSAAGKSNRSWISLSVCWSSNTQLYGKAHFPYNQATIYSSKLWHLKTKHEVLVQVIYEARHRNHTELKKYANQLREEGNYVGLIETGSMECALKAQLTRMLPHTMPFIAPNDIVVTSDVDAFVIDNDIFANLKEPFQIWVYQYKQALRYADLIPACFVAMKSSLWQTLTRFSNSAEQLMTNFEVLGLSKKKGTGVWSIDQIVLTYMILDSKLCILPKTHRLYTNSFKINVSLIPADDSKTCFHGYEYENCFSGRPRLAYGCPWWHFTPSTTIAYLKSKYDEIASGKLRRRPQA